ncbi:MAG: DUF2605 family protein [Synechococcaceae cyanobacterium]|nr:DUF2605 family protein [Synechococcaceae cyanobacterium]
MVDERPVPDPAALLEEVLTPLLQDFQESFERGQRLLAHCPERVMDRRKQETFRSRLEEAQAQLSAARALRAATPAPMALEMATIAPWHELLVEVWALSAALRAAGCHPDQGGSAP